MSTNTIDISINIIIISQKHRTRPQTEIFPTQVDNCSDDLNMGNGCSYGNFRRRRNNAIAPSRHTTKFPSIVIGDTATSTTESQFMLAAKPRRLSTTRAEFSKQIANPKSIDGILYVRAAVTPTPAIFDTPNRISLIDENSILSDTNDAPSGSVAKARPSFVRSASVDSATTETPCIRRESVDDIQLKNDNRHLSRLYQQISGSVQSLFQTNLNLSKKRQFSASDTNLNVCGKPKHNRLLLSQQQLVDSNYCPSVLYSRKSRNATSELNLGKIQTFSRWKNHLWLRVTRKKSESSIRPSKP